MFDSLKKKISSFVEGISEKTEDNISAFTKVKAATLGSTKLKPSEIEDMLWGLETDMLQSDVSVETADELNRLLGEKLKSLELSPGSCQGAVKDAIRDVFRQSMTSDSQVDLASSIRASDRPYVILFLGVNGTGKTTTMAKMANLIRSQGFSVVFAAGDTFRAGAIEQLKEHAQKLGVKVISHQRGADSAAVIYDAVEHAKARNVDVVLADTAGRMQSKVNLMDELKKIISVNKPDLKIFIGDALAGNDAVDQAKAFNDSVGFDAAVLSKLDADAKGGAALSIINSTKKPIMYVGVGQGYDDLKPFDREWFIDSILD